MSTEGKKRHKQFTSSWGFVLSAVGSAVGMANVWGFPAKMGADGDAHGARQRQPAQNAACPAQILFPAGPGHTVGAQGAGAGPAAHGGLGGEAAI